MGSKQIYSVEDLSVYNFQRERGKTPDGYPLPLSGEPIIKTPVITEKGSSEPNYPEHYIPGEEELAENEMRITWAGSWGPAPLRRAQGASSVLVELGNGDKLIIDLGAGTVGNLFSLGVHPAELDKVFITHLHLDHVGGIFPLFDALGWARNTPLHVWGPSGYTPELGIKAFTENVRKAAEWHVQSKQDILSSGGSTITPHEFDVGKFTSDEPEQLIYDENGVKIYAFPVIHTIYGACGFRLEWNGLKIVYTGDSEPSHFEAERAKGVDVFIHEVMPSAEEFSEKNHIPIAASQRVMDQHTTPAELGRVFGIAKPRLGVGMHFPLADDLIDPLFKQLRSTYDGPVMVAQDLTTLNVTKDHIVARQAKTDLLAWPPAPPEVKGSTSKPLGPAEGQRPAWLTETRLENIDE